ncbi:MAG: response regulator transcription factor [Candidatus Sericytochromatia bacterium]|nr:response regulator transcription factor [Candidatus Sericytochromatia bacterium]
MARLLLVEDEDHIAQGLRFNLELDGHVVTWLRDGRQAHEVLFDRQEAFDLIVLDLMLPGISGSDLCRALRTTGNYTPVLMLTAKQHEKDKVQGLQVGADDYVTKPFNLEELLARIEGLLRRRAWEAQRPLAKEAQDDRLVFANVVIDFARHEATVAGQEINLTPIEMAMMKAFKAHEGRVLSREDLLREAWGTEASITTRTVDNFILRLRKLFEPDPAHPVYIRSVRGRGYKFVR